MSTNQEEFRPERFIFWIFQSGFPVRSLPSADLQLHVAGGGGDLAGAAGGGVRHPDGPGTGLDGELLRRAQAAAHVAGGGLDVERSGVAALQADVSGAGFRGHGPGDQDVFQAQVSGGSGEVQKFAVQVRQADPAGAHSHRDAALRLYVLRLDAACVSGELHAHGGESPQPQAAGVGGQADVVGDCGEQLQAASVALQVGVPEAETLGQTDAAGVRGDAESAVVCRGQIQGQLRLFELDADAVKPAPAVLHPDLQGPVPELGDVAELLRLRADHAASPVLRRRQFDRCGADGDGDVRKLAGELGGMGLELSPKQGGEVEAVDGQLSGDQDQPQEDDDDCQDSYDFFHVGFSSPRKRALQRCQKRLDIHYHEEFVLSSVFLPEREVWVGKGHFARKREEAKVLRGREMQTCGGIRKKQRTQASRTRLRPP